MILGIGDELLLGQTADTNGASLARALSELGLEVIRRGMLPDRPGAIRDGVESAMAVAEVVLLTGGLGPTPDDLTRDAVAELLGLPIEVDSGLLERLRARFRARGYGEPPAGSEAMAQVPRGARILANPLGAAPGLALESPQGGLCILLPGVPRETWALLEEEVIPLLRARFGARLRPAVHRTIHTFGVPESVLAQEMAAVLPSDLGGVSLAYLPYQGGVRLRLTARQVEGGPDALEAIRRVEAALEPVVGPFRFESETGSLAEAVGEDLLRAGVTLAVAESCTGGLIAKLLTDVPGSSAYFLGGVVAYANEAKARILRVEERLLERDGAVSRSVAEAMARGVASLFGAEAGIGVTGVAGPGGGTDEKPVGTVWYAASLGQRVVSRRGLFPGDRGDVRIRAARSALFLLLRALGQTPGQGEP